MAKKICLFLFISLSGSMLSREVGAELIVWNVGQGQWATVIDEYGCWHLDMGGEFAPWPEIMRACRSRRNLVSLSHWDIDHIVFAPSALHHLPNICLLNGPEGRSSPRKERWVLNIPRCTEHSPFDQWSDPSGKSANDKSWVVNWRGVLAPGDSTRVEEKKWVHHLAGLDRVRVLILGHHGSRTSTSRELLNSLPNLEMAVSSARVRRYGHPHAEVVRALNQKKTPLLRTEEWGSIHFYF